MKKSSQSETTISQEVKETPHTGGESMNWLTGAKMNVYRHEKLLQPVRQIMPRTSVLSKPVQVQTSTVPDSMELTKAPNTMMLSKAPSV